MKNGYVLMHPAFVSHCIVDWSQKIGYLSQHGEVNMQCKQKNIENLVIKSKGMVRIVDIYFVLHLISNMLHIS